MTKKINEVISEVIKKIEPPRGKMEFISETLENFLGEIKKRIKKLRIEVEVFVGGSYAKNTLIKKNFYDVDLFLRFSKKHVEKDYLKISKKILRFQRGVKVVRGSRDYFRLRVNSWLFFEIVPVKKVTNPMNSQNITDLSYAHSNYIRKKVKSKKIIDGIKLAKAFCHGTKTYGAESYVRGFSGYALELLIYYFGSFEKFLKELSKKREKKLVIDIENFYKKGNVLLDMNGAKLDSPVILVDPTYKARNVLAALSNETFERFQKSASEFLKKPSVDFFEPKKIDFERAKNDSKKKGFEFIKLKIKTKKEKGDVAGAKLLKFFNHLEKEFERCFEVKEKEFEYGEKEEGTGYFTLKTRREIKFTGPFIKDKKNAERFKEEHKKTYEKNGRLFALEKNNFSSRVFLKNWVKKNKRKIKEMSVSGINIF